MKGGVILFQGLQLRCCSEWFGTVLTFSDGYACLSENATQKPQRYNGRMLYFFLCTLQNDSGLHVHNRRLQNQLTLYLTLSELTLLERLVKLHWTSELFSHVIGT